MTSQTIPSAEAIAQAQAYLTTQGTPLSQAQLLEVTARLHGFADFAAMEAERSPPPEDLARICMQYETATHEGCSVASDLVAQLGVTAALAYWRDEQELNISVEPFVVQSEAEQGYWNENQGWVFDKRSATGYPADRASEWSALAPDAQLVEYATAVDFPNLP
jgi:hypothetical protein